MLFNFKNTFLIFCLIYFQNIGLSQSDSTEINKNTKDLRLKKRYGLSSQIGGAYLLGLSFDAFVCKQINIEANFSPVLSITQDGIFVGGGLKYYPLKFKNSINLFPYLGAQFMYYKFNFFGSEEGTFQYFPIGIHFIGNKFLNASVDAGVLSEYNKNGSFLISKFNFFGSVRFGFRF